MTKLEIRNLYKIFSDKPEKVYKLLDKGLKKQAIFEKTGINVGVVNASLKINAGEIFVIMGLSGSGKSTLVRMLNRLIEPTKGEVLLNGQDIAKLSKKDLLNIRRTKISMVFQSFALMPHMNVIDNAAFGLELSKIGREQRYAKAKIALEKVGLAGYEYSHPHELSGGMQQRVGLARALANDPEILLMDEAFSALDPIIRTEMQDELLSLQASDERTIIFISHDLNEAMRIGDRIAIMEDGKVLQVGTPDDILKNPYNDYVKSFFRDVDVSKVFNAKDIVRTKVASIIRKSETDGPRAALKILDDLDETYGVVLAKNKAFIGITSADLLRESIKNSLRLDDSLIKDVIVIDPQTPINDFLGDVASASYDVPVVDEKGNYHGVITKTSILKTLDADL